MSGADEVVHDILIVEPSRTLQSVCAAQCEAFGLRPVFCEGTVEALRRLTLTRVSAILVSLEHDDLPGTSLVSALKCTRRFAAIPVAILTSRADTSGVFRAHQPDAVLRKDSSLRQSIDGFFEDIGLGLAQEDDGYAPLMGMQILVAEDSRVQQKFVAQILHVAGAQVECAANGKEAVEMALDKRFDLILMDIEMPILDGLRAARAIRDEGVDSPIVACTAHSDDAMRKQTQDLGFSSLVAKPIDKVALIELCLEYCPGELEEEAA